MEARALASSGVKSFIQFITILRDSKKQEFARGFQRGSSGLPTRLGTTLPGSTTDNPSIGLRLRE
jgi:hypothetical protein